jgi:hypothetical protein
MARFCGIMAVAVLLYVGSVGPMAARYHSLYKIDMEEWHADNFAKADRAQTFQEKVAPAYEPLSWFGRQSRTFRDTLEWYQCLWSGSDEPLIW